MDMDVTIKSLSLNKENIHSVITNICIVPIDDNVIFQLIDIIFIRDDDEYGGLRVLLNAIYEKINSPLSIDITTGDIITPKPVKRLFKSNFDDATKFKLWTYNTETILAEKIETILRRNIGNTRPRDFYDIYIITKTQKFDRVIFHEALSATSKYRKTSEKIINVSEIIKSIEESPFLKNQWEKYKREYVYAKNIKFEDTIRSIKDLLGVSHPLERSAN